MQDIHDVDVSFRHRFCIHRMALQIMHRVNGAARCVLYLFYFLALPFFILFIFITVLFYSFSGRLQGKLYIIWGFAPDDAVFIYPAIVAGHCLRVPVFLPFLLLWQFRGHDVRMHQFQLESNDQQSSFR